MDCWDGMCGKCRGGKHLVIGALVLLNFYLGWFEWWAFAGWLLVVLGLMKFLMPSCSHCAGPKKRK